MMRRLAVWLTMCALGVALIFLLPSGSAAASVRGAEAQRAIDAALVHAGVSGMTFESGGAVHQRSAAGDVAVVVAKGRVYQMLVREGTLLRLLTPYAARSTYPRIVKAVHAAYAAAAPTFVAAEVSPLSAVAYAPWFDPFAQVAEDPDAEVIVDETGRAVEVRVAGVTTVRILRWDAPLAVRPARDSVITAETAATMAAVEVSADFSYALTKQLAAIANREATYSSEPVATLRRVVHDAGWIARASQGGVTITTTDSLGATWRAILVAARSGVRVEDFALLSHRKAMPETQAQALLSLSVTAMSQVDLLSCPAACRMTGKPAPITVANAETRILGQLGRLGITSQTPGPTYPSIGDGMSGSFGLTVSGERISGGFSMSTGGFCLRVPIVGPGVLPRPTAYLAVPGSIGPLGTCALSPDRA